MKIHSRFGSSAFLLAAAALRLGCGNAARVGGPPKEEDPSGRSGGVVAVREGKEYVRDESKSIEEAVARTSGNRAAKSCGANERVLNFKFTTDDYGYETSFEWREVGGGLLASGPTGNRNYGDGVIYSFQYCVKAGREYRLKIKDKMKDGLCCEYGRGTYSFKVDGESVYDSKRKRTFSHLATKTFRVKALSSTQSDGGGGGSSGAGCITVKAKGDRHPDELSWRILDSNGNRVGSSPPLQASAPVSKEVCVPRGRYVFEMRDSYGDGMCCGSGDGYYIVYLDGKELVRGSHFARTKRHVIQVDPTFEGGASARDAEWLTAHNRRRRKYHGEFGRSYVPLKWSPQMAAQARRWANELLDGCDRDGIEHEGGVEHGENLAKNRGSGGFAMMYAADDILTRWVEKERYVGYPKNSHMTQVLWRASKYLGCGEASKPYNGGRETCRVQVCRYATAGNCSMRGASGSNGWKAPMLEDRSGCGPECAPEGCY